MKHAIPALALAFVVGLTASVATAQPAPASKPPAAQNAAPPAPPKEVLGPEISMLIRTTMIGLHQANMTGNYTVLRDLGADILQKSNSAADLAVLFAEFRKRQFNLAPTVLFDATLDEKPKLSTDGQLRLVGHFPTKPQEVLFDLTFHYENGAWRIALISVGSRMAVAEAQSAKPKPKPVAKPKPAETAAEPKPDPNAAMDLVPPTPRPRPKS